MRVLRYVLWMRAGKTRPRKSIIFFAMNGVGDLFWLLTLEL